MKAKTMSSLQRKKQLSGLIFVAPWIIGAIMFFFLPIVQVVSYSFSDVFLGGKEGVTTVGVGFANYNNLFKEDATFLPTLTSSLLDVLADTPVILIFSLVAAMLINRKFPGCSVVRVIFFLPVIYGTGLILQTQQNDSVYKTLIARINGGDADMAMSALISGMDMKQLVQSIAGNLDFVADFANYIVSAVDRVFTIINRSGVQTLLFLAALKSVPVSMYEAANVEGANGLDQFWKIRLPMLGPHILTNMVYTVVDSFTHVDNPMIDMIRKMMFNNQNVGLGATMAVIYCLSIAAALVLVFVFCRLTGIVEKR